MLPVSEPTQEGQRYGWSVGMARLVCSHDAIDVCHRDNLHGLGAGIPGRFPDSPCLSDQDCRIAFWVRRSNPPRSSTAPG